MAVEARRTAGVVDTRGSPYAHWRSLSARGVTLDQGFWARRQLVNREVSLGHGYAMLEHAGNLGNFRRAAGLTTDAYRGPVFMDSDVYKWLEAMAYEMLRLPLPEWSARLTEVLELIRSAQQDDGYLNTYYQVAEPGRRWTDLSSGHEMYCAGHLFQAAVAFHRATGDDRLLRIALRLADHIDSVFGADGSKRVGTPGHPEIEMGLVELYRETAEPRYLRLAEFLVDQRGHGLLGPGRYNSSAYYQDRIPVREASSVEGHAVRAMYLMTGLTDIYLETGDQALFAALERQWRDMVNGKMYITGGLGSRHLGEAFGQPYELPNEAAYCETCAAIGSFNWNWRMLLATGEARFADVMERTLFNAFLSGTSLSGDRYFYTNPLLSQGRTEVLNRTAPERSEWHRVACCPPNVMRTLASLGNYFVTSDATGLQIHQYSHARIVAELATGASVALSVQTDYPWDGRVVLSVDETPAEEWTLALRIPAWSEQTGVLVNGSAEGLPAQPGTYAAVRRAWRQGDRVELMFGIDARLIAAHPWIESSRGHLAIERGPFVYCIEQADQPGQQVLDLEIDAAGPLESTWQPDLLDGVMQVTATGLSLDTSGWSEQLYRPVKGLADATTTPVDLVAIPYYAWANRGPGAMRVWIPRSAHT